MFNPIPDRPSDRSELGEWYESVLAEQEQSGLSVGEFAEVVGVTATTLYSWRRRLSSRRLRGPAKRTGLVEVRVIDEKDPPALEPTAPPPLVLRFGRGRCVEVPPDFDGAHLTRLVEALESC